VNPLRVRTVVAPAQAARLPTTEPAGDAVRRLRHELEAIL